MSVPLILIGAGGHAKVLHDLALEAGHQIVGVCDPALVTEQKAFWNNTPVLGGDEALAGVDPTKVGLILGIGKLVNAKNRERLYEQMRAAGFSFPALIHSTAWVAPSVVLSDGVQVMAGCIIQSGCVIGENTIVNTRASVDHDCVLGANVHVAPGSILCGDVRVGDCAYIGAGAVIIQGLQIGADAIVGAGATVIRNVMAGQTSFGISSHATQKSRIN